ncbi:MAG TPA: MBL fold metallo-hydrolase [Cyclobacteriaceae bacterium]|nr:MBL fold metallo-hydrolase [Cyclobacteriaceae bacterium]
MFLTIAILLLIVATPIIIGLSLSAPTYHGPISDHFDGKKFINPKGIKAKGLPDVFRWMRERKRGKWEKKQLKPGAKPLPRYDNGVRITFVNHSTFLIQVDGVNILTDPVWSERVSPFTFAGPQRMRPPGIAIDDLPKIDLVLLSHNHYDHLDIATVKHIHDKYNPQFIVPLGVSGYLKNKKIELVSEIDWWQTKAFGTGFTIECVPAQHFSGRGTFDRDQTLWCGYCIHGRHGNIYFAGDTGYNPDTFKEIGLRTKPTLSIIPIGAFKPEWFMSPIHCSPEEAVQIHKDLKSPQSIASHFGTFPLADDGGDDPVEGLRATLLKEGLAIEQFVALEEGVAKDF